MVAYLRLDYVLSPTSPPVVDMDWLLSSLDNRIVEPSDSGYILDCALYLNSPFHPPRSINGGSETLQNTFGLLAHGWIPVRWVWMYPWTTELFYTQKRDRLGRLCNLQSHTDFSFLILYKRKNKTPYHSLCSIIFSVGQGQRPKGES